MSNNGKRSSLLHSGIIYQVKLKLHVYASGTRESILRKISFSALTAIVLFLH